MNTHTHHGHRKSKKSASNDSSGVDAGEMLESVEQGMEEKMEAVREQVEHVRDFALEMRDKAKVAFEEKPYLVPLAAGALGVGVGVLLGSKLTRFLVVTAVGTLLTDFVGTTVKRMGKDFLSELQLKLTEATGGGGEGGDTAHSEAV